MTNLPPEERQVACEAMPESWNSFEDEHLNIVIVCSYFGPETSVGVNRVNSFARHWLALGHTVDVFTMPFSGELPDYLKHQPRLSIHQVRPLLHSPQKIGSVQSYNGSSGISKTIKKLFYFIKKHFFANYLDPRVLWWPVAARRIKAFAAKTNVDVILTSVPSYTAHSIGAYVKHHHSTVYWVADYRDLWSGNPIFPGAAPVRAFERWHERFILKNADLLVTINQDLADYLTELHKNEKILLVPNGFEPSDFESLPLEEQKNSSTKQIVFTGTVLKGLQNPEPLFQAVCNLINQGKLRSADLQIHFYGDTTAIEKTARFLFLLQHEMLILHGRVPRNLSLQAQKNADLLLFLGSRPVKGGTGTLGVVSGKIFEYLNSGTEIMGVGVSEKMIVAEMIQQAGAGEIFDQDVAKIETKLISLARHGKQKINPNLQYISQFNRKEQADYLLRHIENHLRSTVE